MFVLCFSYFVQVRYFYLLYTCDFSGSNTSVSWVKYNTTEKKKSVSTHSEIRFQLWYDDVSHERTTFQILFLSNIVKIMFKAGGKCVISLFLETHVYFQGG